MYLLITHIIIIFKFIPEDLTRRHGGAEEEKEKEEKRREEKRREEKRGEEKKKKRRWLRIPIKNSASLRDALPNQSN